MRFPDMVVYAINALRKRSIRSWLTVIGIVIGITSIVILVGLVQGLKDTVSDQLQSFGSDTIVVIPTNVEQSGASAASSWLPSSGKLYLKDYERLKRIGDIEDITPVINGRTYVKYKDKEITVSVVGIQPDVYKETVGTLEIESGRFLVSQDRQSVVAGYDLATDSFDDPIQLSSNIDIMDKKYTVAGILKKTGNSFSNLDSSLLISFDEAQEMFKDVLSENEISAIRMTVKDGVNPKEVADEVNYLMLAAHRVTEDKKDFSIVTADFINQQVETVTSLLTLFLGAIGIANTMFMSVTERKGEIGILKSIGATEKEILYLFLVESSMIGVAGGFFGLLLAYLLSGLIEFAAGISVSISLFVIFGAIIFSATVGILSGVFPAREAAKLDPIAALR